MIRQLLLGGAVLLAAGPATAQAASFDCAKAKGAAETAICKDPDLSALDSEMGGLWYAYHKFPLLMGASGARQDAQQAFLKKRAACGDETACLQTLYQARIDTLRKSISTAVDKGMLQVGNAADERVSQSIDRIMPPAVATIVQGYEKLCTKLDGKLTNPDALRVMASDLDGDQRMDYVLDPEKLQCSNSATAYCGNGGCQIGVALSSKDYGDHLVVLGAQPALRQTDAATQVEVWVSNSKCPNRKENQACWAVYSWQDGTASPQFEARALQN